ncbi:MAG: hypothetical protein ACI8Q1_000029 [Parvicella sp.]|jgi:hypothetical protein
MEALQTQYKGLKEIAKALMEKGNLNEYFSTITAANALHIKILQLNLKSK